MTLPPAPDARGLLDHPLLRDLLALGLDPGDFVVFGSGPLLAHGIRTDIDDLDVVARGAAWRRAADLGTPAVGEVSGDPIRSLAGGRIQVSRRWISDAWDTDDLIARADVVAGVRFAALADVLAYKRVLMRPKDVEDIALLEARMRADADGV